MILKHSNLSRLIAGNFINYKELKDVFEYQTSLIVKMEKAIICILLENNEESISLLGSFYGRKILESFCNIMIGRLDPVRLISIKNVQKKNFSIDKKMPIAIQWAGDVFEKKGDKSPDDLWHNSLSSDKVSRPLLGLYFFEMFWKPAFSSAQDFENLGAHWYSDYGEDFTIDKFHLLLRSEVSKLYSKLSKGVHSELVINIENTLDSNSIKDTLKDTLKFISTMSLLSHFIDTAISKIDYQEAYDIYTALRKTYSYL